MHHLFDVDVAKEYGVEEAIMITNFQYWISHNAANGKNYKEGQYWTYNSYNALAKIFPYWSAKQVRRIIGDLVDKMVLRTGNFNEKDYDGTKWYAFVNEARWIGDVANTPARLGMGTAQTGRDAEMDSTHALSGTPHAQTGKPIPDNTTQIDNTIKKQRKKNKEKELPTAPGIQDEAKKDSEAPQVPPVAPPPHAGKLFEEEPVSTEKGPKPKGKETLYQLMMKTYFEWCIDVIGAEPVIDGGQGKAMKSLRDYFIKVVCKRAENERANGAEITAEQIDIAVNSSWGKLLAGLASDSVEPFLRKQTKLTQIYSNLQNILNQLKNGTGKQQPKASAATKTVEDVYSSFNKRFNRI